MLFNIIITIIIVVLCEPEALALPRALAAAHGEAAGCQTQRCGQQAAGPRRGHPGSQSCSCNFRPNRWQSQPGLRLGGVPTQEPLPSEILQTRRKRERRHLTFTFLSARYFLSDFKPLSESDGVLCSMSEIWNKRKQPQTMDEVTTSAQWRYLKSQGSPQAVLGLSLVQGLPVLFYFQFHICSGAKIK